MASPRSSTSASLESLWAHIIFMSLWSMESLPQTLLYRAARQQQDSRDPAPQPLGHRSSVCYCSSLSDYLFTVLSLSTESQESMYTDILARIPRFFALRILTITDSRLPIYFYNLLQFLPSLTTLNLRRCALKMIPSDHTILAMAWTIGLTTIGLEDIQFLEDNGLSAGTALGNAPLPAGNASPPAPPAGWIPGAGGLGAAGMVQQAQQLHYQAQVQLQASAQAQDLPDPQQTNILDSDTSANTTDSSSSSWDEPDEASSSEQHAPSTSTQPAVVNVSNGAADDASGVDEVTSAIGNAPVAAPAPITTNLGLTSPPPIHPLRLLQAFSQLTTLTLTWRGDLAVSFLRNSWKLPSTLHNLTVYIKSLSQFNVSSVVSLLRGCANSVRRVRMRVGHVSKCLEVPEVRMPWLQEFEGPALMAPAVLVHGTGMGTLGAPGRGHGTGGTGGAGRGTGANGAATTSNNQPHHLFQLVHNPLAMLTSLAVSDPVQFNAIITATGIDPASVPNGLEASMGVASLQNANTSQSSSTSTSRPSSASTTPSPTSTSPTEVEPPGGEGLKTLVIHGPVPLAAFLEIIERPAAREVENLTVLLQTWDAEVMFAVSQLLPGLKKLVIVYATGPGIASTAASGPSDEFLVSIGPELLPRLSSLHTLVLQPECVLAAAATTMAPGIGSGMGFRGEAGRNMFGNGVNSNAGGANAVNPYERLRGRGPSFPSAPALPTSGHPSPAASLSRMVPPRSASLSCATRSRNNGHRSDRQSNTAGLVTTSPPVDSAPDHSMSTPHANPEYVRDILASWQRFSTELSLVSLARESFWEKVNLKLPPQQEGANWMRSGLGFHREAGLRAGWGGMSASEASPGSTRAAAFGRFVEGSPVRSLAPPPLSSLSTVSSMSGSNVFAPDPPGSRPMTPSTPMTPGMNSSGFGEQQQRHMPLRQRERERRKKVMRWDHYQYPSTCCSYVDGGFRGMIGRGEADEEGEGERDRGRGGREIRTDGLRVAAISVDHFD